MAEKNLYICNICRTSYENKEDAVKCEKEHTNICGISDFRFCACEKYPHKVEIVFKDGTKRWYSE